MISRPLPRDASERYCAIGMALAPLACAPRDEAVRVMVRAMREGVDLFDVGSAPRAVCESFGVAMREAGVGADKKIFLMLDASDERAFEESLSAIGASSADFALASCDGDDPTGALALAASLVSRGRARRVGARACTYEQAALAARDPRVELIVMPIDPSRDLEAGAERAELLIRCARRGIGVVATDPFRGGSLLGASSPFRSPLSVAQCVQYALDRPAVLSVVCPVLNDRELDLLLEVETLPPSDRDWSCISAFVPSSLRGACLYCAHCRPCPAGINIAAVNRCRDTEDSAAYAALPVKAGACVRCRRCDDLCPFGARPADRIREALGYFGE